VSDAARPQWTPEIDVDEDLARTLIGRRFPELAALRGQRFGNGWDNAAFLAGNDYVFRFPRRAFAAPLIVLEAQVLPAIAPALPVPIPVPLFVGEADEDYPWSFAGYRTSSTRGSSRRTSRRTASGGSTMRAGYHKRGNVSRDSRRPGSSTIRRPFSPNSSESPRRVRAPSRSYTATSTRATF
jgi:hypothetical protein